MVIVMDKNMISPSVLLVPKATLYPTSYTTSYLRKRGRRLTKMNLGLPCNGRAFVIDADRQPDSFDTLTQGDKFSIAGEDKSQFPGTYGIRRRSLTSMIILPFLLSSGLKGSDAFAKQIDTPEMSIIRNEVRKFLSKYKAAGMLRLAFHDAGTFDLKEQTGGMNGSIIYELDRPENAGLDKSIKALEKVKHEVDKIIQVSWADLIAVAGSEAVSLCKGPIIPVDIGRIDASSPDQMGKLPLETLDASGLKSCFLEKGFSTQELVALSGAHTLGNKGFGNPFVFDNSYFKILIERPWTSPDGMSSMIGLPSDRALVEDEECLRWIKVYAADEVRFFDDFSNAYRKLVNSGASWGTDGI